MTLDEAIIHCEDVANSKCDKCGEEHRQLAGWALVIAAWIAFGFSVGATIAQAL